MSAYATTTQLSSLSLTPDLVTSSTPEEMSVAIQAASDEADGYLNQRYTLPLSGFGLDLTRNVCHIAAWELAVTKNLAPEGGETSNLYLRCKNARAWLKMVAKGEVSPVGITDSGSGSSGGSGASGSSAGLEIRSLARRGW
jgi:phage gp36-like protein